MSYTEENISNFEKSCKFFERELTKDDLYGYLRCGSDFEKQLACIRIETCDSDREAEIFIENLTGVDGKIREAVSFKLNGFIAKSPELFKRKDFYEIFLNAIIDINGNICRNIISALHPLTLEPEFCDYFSDAILERADKVLDVIDNFNYKDRKFVTNKEHFKLYWYLETLSTLQITDEVKLFDLLARCIKLEEYTIREKSAQLFTKLPQRLRKELSGINFDNNFYVNLALTK